MTDVHSKEVRSYNMSRIRSKNTTPELLVRKKLHKLGFRYRIHVNKLPGNPDIVLSKYKVVIQVNGCFWHGHARCKYYKIPKKNSEWWESKIRKNTDADCLNTKKLQDLGWRVIVLYECELSKNNIDFIINQLKIRIQQI